MRQNTPSLSAIAMPAGNPQALKTNEGVVFDSVHPSLVGASLNYSDGVITMTFSEIIDNTPGDILVKGVSVLRFGGTDTSSFS